jgi:hypothetical protein
MKVNLKIRAKKPPAKASGLVYNIFDFIQVFSQIFRKAIR